MEERQTTLRNMLLELSRDPETIQSVKNALLGCLEDPKIKPGDALKIYDALSGAQEKEAASGPPPDVDGLDLESYSDEELRELFFRLGEPAEASVPAASGPAPSVRETGSRPGDGIRLRLEDFLRGRL